MKSKKMVKLKKSLSFLVITFVLLGNFAFAQSTSGEINASTSSDKVNFKGGLAGSFNLDNGHNDNEGQNSMDNNHDEMQFNHNDFSYEQKGFGQSYDAGPSYEGYSQENMIFGMVFEKIGNDIDPREIKQYCSDPNKIADIVIAKLKSKVGDIASLCKKIEERESNCNDYSKKMCSLIGTPVINANSNEMEKVQSVAFSCPANKDAIIGACLIRSRSYMEQQMKNIDQSCEQRASMDADRINKECDNFRSRQVCDRDKYISQCISNSGARKEDFDGSGKRKPVCPVYSPPACGDGIKIETKTDANGCSYYYCAQSTSQCPTQTTPTCKQGETVQKRADDKGCNYYYCQAAANSCPEAAQPACSSNMHAERKTDDKGCVSYYCTSNPCPPVTKPSCSTGETVQAYYDNAGCVASYQCIKQQPACTEPAKPNCSDGKSMTTRYDSNGCPSYECITIASNSSSSGITGAVILSTYDDYVKQCESNWQQQEKMCKNMESSCDKANFADRCRENANKNNEEFKLRIGETCKSQTQSQIAAAEDKCSRIDKEKSKCEEQTGKRCSQMKGLSEKCKSTLTEENLRKFIISEAEKRCKFSDKLEDKESIQKSEKAEIVLAVLNKATQSDFDKLKLFVSDLKEDLKLQDTTVYKGTINPTNFGDIKLLPFVVNAKISTASSSEKSDEAKEKIVASRKVEDTASKLASLRDSDVPSQYLYIIEDKANDVLNVSGKLGEIEKKDDQKGIGYKMKLFFGLAKAAEQNEIAQLEESKTKLNNSITTLTKLIDEVPSDVAKAVLKEQVESLKKQQEDIEVLITAKQKKSKGFFGIFG